MRSALAAAAAVAVALAGIFFGLWWLTFPAGMIAGVIAPRARVAIPLGAAAGLVAWAVPLAISEWTYGLASTASSLAAIMGFGHQGAIPLALTLLVGLLLGVTGAWIASAMLLLVRRSPGTARGEG